MKLRHAFALALLAVLVVMAFPAFYAVQKVGDVRRIALDLREQAAQAAFAVGRLQTDLAQLDRYHRAYVVTGDPDLAASAQGAVSDVGRQLDRLRSAGYAAVLDRIDFPMARLEASTRRTELLMDEGQLEDATAHFNVVVRPLITEAEHAAAALAIAVDEATVEKTRRANSIATGAVNATTLGLFFALVLACAAALIAARLLVRPIEDLSVAMNRVAGGNFQPPADLPYERTDEIGDLFRSFRSMAYRLADLDRMKAAFMGVASHDLKTPVNVITGYAELIEEELAGTLDRRHRQIMRSLYEQTRTMGRRLEQLLEISRMEASGLRLGLEEINVRHFAASIEKSYGSAAARQRIDFSVLVDENAPSFVIADPDCLRTEVIGNLLDNALRFTARGGSIRMRIGGEGGMVVVHLADTGLGIPPEDLPNVFDKYHQGRGRPGRAGAGLGLPIAREGIEAHGGEIDIQSPPTGGVMFRVRLPIHPTLRPEELTT